MNCLDFGVSTFKGKTTLVSNVYCNTYRLTKIRETIRKDETDDELEVQDVPKEIAVIRSEYLVGKTRLVSNEYCNMYSTF